MSVCTSINEVVCHGIPKEEDVLEEGDIINVDFTTILDGYYADASRMFIIGKTTPEKEQLVRVAKECLEIGMEAAKPYSFVGDIGHAIEKHCKKYGYGIVRAASGQPLPGNFFLFQLPGLPGTPRQYPFPPGCQVQTGIRAYPERFRPGSGPHRGRYPGKLPAGRRQRSGTGSIA